MNPTVRRVSDPRQLVLYGVGVILAGSLLFGCMAVCVRIAAPDVPSAQIAFVRFAGSLLVLLALGGGRSLRPNAGNLGTVLLRGMLGSFAIVFYFRGIEYAGAGLATLLHCTYPVSTAAFATRYMGEPFNARLGVALALAVVGVVVVLGPGAELSSATLLGGGFALVASVLSGGAVAAARHLRVTESAYLVTTHFMAVGTACTLPSLFSGVTVPSAGILLALVGVVLTSVGGQILLHHGLGFAPATQGSLAAATAVLTAAGLESLFFAEHLANHTLAGACFLIGSVALAIGGRQT